MTSSIAVKLEFPLDKSDTVTAEHLLYQNIMDNLTARVRLDPKDIDISKTEVRFLGFGQNLYEGGKPQFYYTVHLGNIDTENYIRLTAHKQNASKYDMDKCVYVADYDSYRFHKDTISMNIIGAGNKRKKMTVHYEMSYLCNIWHYEQDKLSRSSAPDTSRAQRLTV